MGQGHAYSCKSCGFRYEAFTGIGMAYYCLENVLDCLHYTKRKKVLDILNKHNIEVSYGDDSTEYEHRTFRCSKCGNFHNRFYVKLTDSANDNVLYETVYKCSKCKNELDAINELQEFPCPVCKNRTWESELTMNWD